MYRIFLYTIIVWVAGCERDGLSPVEIKIDDEPGYAAIGNTALAATHIVSNEETLFDVAFKYNIDPMNLAKINGIKSPYNVRNGQILRLPEESPSAPEEIATTESEIPKYKEPLQKEKPKKDELDDGFATIIATKNKSSPSATKTTSTANSTGTSFNEQENFLSSPKVTKTASGKSIESSSNDSGNVTKSSNTEKPKLVTSNKMISPANGKIISRFGDVKDGISNDGINIKAPIGAPVKVAASGDVIYAGNKLEEFGNTVIVQHDNGLITSYAHLNNINVKNGAKINSGDIIGSVGKTGDVTESQLHFEILKNKTPVDPEKYLAK
ncbi:MAG: M23 family metallopeptidase [Holosporaceae bacterium]|jgi:murein DD-endopeptidase MepM/ murein hydrolase activator NlpD|nr:M23 family metallopeptidase [Holosporaceae bacterium]